MYTKFTLKTPLQRDLNLNLDNQFQVTLILNRSGQGGRGLRPRERLVSIPQHAAPDSCTKLASTSKPTAHMRRGTA